MRHLLIDLSLIGLAPGAVAWALGYGGLLLLLTLLAAVVLWPDRRGK